MGRWKTRREERRITATLDPWSDLWPTCRPLRPRPPGEDAPSHDAQVGGRHASAGAAENIEGAPVITPQKFIAELRMLRTRAKELGLPITASIIGRAIEVCEGERDGDFLTVRRIEGPEVGTRSTGRVAQHREKGQKRRRSEEGGDR